MYKNYLISFIQFSILPIAIVSIQQFTSLPIGNTFIWWVVQVSILLGFWLSKYYFFEPENAKLFLVIKLYLIWNIFSISRGPFFVENYWDIKGLIGNGMALLIPIVAYTASQKEILQSILHFYVRYTIPIFILFIPFLPIGAWGWYFFPLSFLVLFFPIFRLQWKIIIIALIIAVSIGDLSARSHTIKYGMPLLILVLYYLRFFLLSTQTIELIRKFLMIAPWILFFLAVSGIFNVFKMDQYLKGNFVEETSKSIGESKGQEITNDSRTFLYEEVISSSKKYNYWLLGRTPARGHETSWFAFMDVTGRNERLRDEVGILNVYTWTGIIGVILYFIVFYRASYIAINRSNNIYSKLIGLFVAFRWVYAWVEDINMFNINYFTIWLMIGICFSRTFRIKNNAEVRLWVWGIFEKRYYIFYRRYYNLKGNKITS